jgi:hypothetical protein
MRWALATAVLCLLTACGGARVAPGPPSAPVPQSHAAASAKLAAALRVGAAPATGELDMGKVEPFAWDRMMFLSGPSSRATLLEQLASARITWPRHPDGLGYLQTVVAFVRDGQVVDTVSSHAIDTFACVVSSRAYGRHAAVFDVLRSRLRDDDGPIPVLATRGGRGEDESRCLRTVGAAP